MHFIFLSNIFSHFMNSFFKTRYSIIYNAVEHYSMFIKSWFKRKSNISSMY